MIIRAALISLLFATLVFAESPTDAVNAVHQEIKETGSLRPMVDMFDFDAAYEELPSEERQEISKQQFTTFARGAMINPAQTMINMMPPEMQPMAAQMATQFRAQLEDSLKNTTTKVLDEQIDGENALLTIESDYKGQVRQDKLKLRKSDGKWKFVYSEAIDQILKQAK